MLWRSPWDWYEYRDLEGLIRIWWGFFDWEQVKTYFKVVGLQPWLVRGCLDPKLVGVKYLSKKTKIPAVRSDLTLPPPR